MAPALPAELIHRIIVLSLPSTISFETLADRYAILLPYTLIYKSWTPWAQLELYRHVLLEGDDRVARFAASTEGTSSRLVGQVVSLRAAGGDGEDELEGLRELLEQCTGLVDLRLKNVDVTLETLAAVPSLTQLHLCDLQLHYTELVQPFRLANLAQLSLVKVDPHPYRAWRDILSSTSLPCLRTLALAFDLDRRGSTSSSISELAQALTSTANLTTMVINDPYQLSYPYFDEVWPILSQLQSLSLARNVEEESSDLLLRSALKLLPSSLQQVRLIPPSKSEDCESQQYGTQLEQLSMLLKESPVSLQGLKRLVLSPRLPLCDDCSARGEYGKLTAVEATCIQLGIEIVHEDGEGGDAAAFAGWEGYLNES